MRGRAGQLAVLVLLGCAPLCAHCETGWHDGLVVSVQDGVHLKVATPGNHARLMRIVGVCAPEIGHAYGRKSKFSLSDLALLKTVQWRRQGESVSVSTRVSVMVDGRDLATLQLERGMAAIDFATTDQLQGAQRDAYTQAQDRARKARAGFWGLSSVAPCGMS